MNDTARPRAPRVFDPDDPGVVVTEPVPEPAPARPTGTTASGTGAPGTTGPEAAAADGAAAGRGGTVQQRPLGERIGHGVRWGSLLVGAAFALASLAAGLWFARFVSVALARQDWLGWVATGLAALMALAAFVLVVREIVGLRRLGRLGDLRRRADRLRATPDVKGERLLVADLRRVLARKGDMAWATARLAEHERGVHDAGALLLLAERELVAPLDSKARALVARSAKRVSVVTAVSPAAAVTVVFVAVETLRLIRALAENYGGRPGFLGGMRLARLVLVHLVATGSVALTDDLLGQFLGQDLLRRVSRRLGEGIFNGALTARIGAAAVDVIRPLPFIEATPVRARDFVKELMRRSPEPPAAGKA
jgi:putative membrane protein